MANYRVTCITIPHANALHEHITHIGNGPDGWKITAEEAISSITAKRHAFYIQDDLTGKTSYLAVVEEEGKAPHLRIHADGCYNDNLLELGQCYI